ncbi:MAG: CDP-diacylglycerol--glycerol-3-phosphate 3-phosphatidyltransferase [Oscillospiraceae bacterium]|nr:CDP-diacylglycerol--glycerol-3-phosphate 3-phosphatidyltransferase [Oscillospiraceae bacterium]
MNLANKLTLMRVILVPVFVVFMAVDAIPLNYLWALAVFGIASLTDMIDGKVARKYNMITDFGKFLDPLADKILVAAALVCMVELKWTYSWVVVIILVREFAVSGVRLVAAGSEKKVVIAAGWLGKVKTAVTMVAIAVILVLHVLTDNLALIPTGAYVGIISDVLMIASAALTLWSGIQYMYDYREFIDPKK